MGREVYSKIQRKILTIRRLNRRSEVSHCRATFARMTPNRLFFRKNLPLLALVVAALFLNFSDNRPFANLSEARWVDSVFNAMTDAERYGQLFVIRAHSDKDTAYENDVERLVRQYQPGGLCFFNPSRVGTPERQAELTNRYQAASHVPHVLPAIATRLDSILSPLLSTGCCSGLICKIFFSVKSILFLLCPIPKKNLAPRCAYCV
ncbi:MAG TPA: hypothetical protein PK971_11200, partial [Saprospiraceae bacterium]|nr:hypothetical protein [Saprospiraceae bacterium]HND88888.1 hypothetical protein [Saprospiraceae bacterium]